MSVNAKVVLLVEDDVTLYTMCQRKGRISHLLVITPFLPPGFSRVSARKTRQPGPSRSDPTRARRIKYSQEEGPRHISQGLAKFD
jgi:hypothetical protein